MQLLLFGTNRRLAKILKNLEVKYDQLVAELINSLYLNSQFGRNYKKVSSCLKAIHFIRQLLTNKSAKGDFTLMVLLRRNVLLVTSY